jgi:YD repeat-containing protein
MRRQPDQDQIRYTIYDAAGHVIATVDGAERTTRTYYDETDRTVVPVAAVEVK